MIGRRDVFILKQKAVADGSLPLEDVCDLVAAYRELDDARIRAAQPSARDLSLLCRLLEAALFVIASFGVFVLMETVLVGVACFHSGDIGPYTELNYWPLLPPAAVFIVFVFGRYGRQETA